MCVHNEYICFASVEGHSIHRCTKTITWSIMALNRSCVERSVTCKMNVLKANVFETSTNTKCILWCLTYDDSIKIKRHRSNIVYLNIGNEIISDSSTVWQIMVAIKNLFVPLFIFEQYVTLLRHWSPWIGINQYYYACV